MDPQNDNEILRFGKTETDAEGCYKLVSWRCCALHVEMNYSICFADSIVMYV